MKIRVNYEYDYEVDPKNYPDGASPTQMAWEDMEGDPAIRGWPEFVKVTAEVLDDNI